MGFDDDRDPTFLPDRAHEEPDERRDPACRIQPIGSGEQDSHSLPMRVILHSVNRVSARER